MAPVGGPPPLLQGPLVAAPGWVLMRGAGREGDQVLVLATEVLAAYSDGVAGRTSLRLKCGAILQVADTPEQILSKIREASRS